MKCQYCGTNLGLEDEKCPHCGKINTLATKYVEEIKEYKEDLDETKKDVKEKVRIGARTGRLIVIIAMIIVVAIMQLAINNLSDFDKREKQNREKTKALVSKNQDDIRANLVRMEKDREYLELDYFTLNYQLRSNDDYMEYTRVDTAAISYSSIYENILNIVTNFRGYENETNKDYCASIASVVSTYRQYAEGEFWHDSKDSPMHAGEHDAFIQDAKKDIQDMVQVYFELSDEQAMSIWDMGEEELNALLYSKCQDLYPEGGSDE